MTTTKDATEERKRLMKVELNEEIKQRDNRIMANHLRDKNCLREITVAVYAIVRAVEIKLDIKRPLRKEKKTKENRRVMKMKKQIRAETASSKSRK